MQLDFSRRPLKTGGPMKIKCTYAESATEREKGLLAWTWEIFKYLIYHKIVDDSLGRFKSVSGSGH